MNSELEEQKFSLEFLLKSKTEKIDELQGLLDYKQKKLDAEIKESEANLS